MRVVSHKKLKDFYETKGCEDSRVALERWYDIAEKAEWRNLSDIVIAYEKEHFPIEKPTVAELIESVSYTHLVVYKRQAHWCACKTGCSERGCGKGRH